MKRIPWSGSLFRRHFLCSAALGSAPLILPGHVLGLNGAAPPSERITLGFIGVGNTGWRGRLEASSENILKTKVDPAQSRIWPMPKGEHRNFLDCVKSRQPTTYTAEAGHRLSSVMHIGSLSMQLGRKLNWDPAAESFAGDEEANALRSRKASVDWIQ